MSRVLYLVLFLVGSLFCYAISSMAGGIDVYTRLLLHMDNLGTQSFIDSGVDGRGVTVGGNTIGSGSQLKFGLSSGYSDGVGDYLQFAPAGLGLGTNFTIDCWVNFEAITLGLFFGSRFDFNDWFAFYYGYGSLQFRQKEGGVYTILFREDWVPVLNQWYHLAVVCDNGTYYFFVDGVQLGSSQYFAAPVKYIVAWWRVFDDGTTDGFQGFIDELRLSVGIARWVTNFVPPSSAYSVSAGIGSERYLFLLALSGMCCGVLVVFGIILVYRG